jgi:hypothetical protein
VEEKVIASVILAPSLKQRKQLDELFSGPRLIAQLLREEGDPIRWPDEASFFLLKNKAKLEPFLFTQDREEAIDLLKSLVLRWSNTPPSKFGISFDSECSISATNQVFFPLQHLGALEVKEPERLREHRRGTRYKEGFSLFYTGSDFFADISFSHRPEFIETHTNTAERSSIRTHTRDVAKQTNPIKPAPAFEYRDYLKIFDQRITQQLLHELKISKSLKTVRFNELSGRSVQGGLPSLGRKR